MISRILFVICLLGCGASQKNIHIIKSKCERALDKYYSMYCECVYEYNDGHIEIHALPEWNC